ncbi:type I secretion protein [Tsuneonella deserti]|uniref:Type I secretion protein n=1 Tax=Tsuneonella deserti TaxID=2035528 RepID=A0ABQ1S9Q6_9SPHN|nr:type I secretion system permease/ATPase [Tsuneonella deserti]GGE03305.1 type I secretion protein [Tsuneonella deserti]
MIHTSVSRQLISRFLGRYRSTVRVIVAATILLNLTLFAGAIYMLLVYDMILPSGSVATLIALFGMLILVYLFQGIIDAARSELLLRLARGIHHDLAPLVHHAAVTLPLRRGVPAGDGAQIVRDLDQVYGFIASPGPVALIDLPWVALFLIVLTLLHVWLGVAALLGIIAMAAIAWYASVRTQDASRDLAQITSERNARLNTELRLSEVATAIGMRQRLSARSAEADERYRTVQGALSTIVARFGGAGRVFRIFVQSLILTVGALLVMDNEASGGIIIASSVLAGRALAPVDQAIATWRGFVAARTGWERIVQAISESPPPSAREVQLDPPSRSISVNGLWLAPPGSREPVVKGVSFTLQAGEALAIIGPSAAGKTSFIKALLGIWTPLRGEVRFDGALHSHWDADVLGAAIGYVPQSVELVDGTVGENIARLDPLASSGQIIEAARKAGLHETILALPNGYDTRLTSGGLELSAGQRQRLGLARALFGDPFLLVLDEANSNLDQDGDAALARAILAHRQKGGIVVMITHRPATLGPVTHLGVMRAGQLADLGSKDDVLQRTFKQPASVSTQDAAA